MPSPPPKPSLPPSNREQAIATTGQPLLTRTQRSFWNSVVLGGVLTALISAVGAVVTERIAEPTGAVCQAAFAALGDETFNPHLTPAQVRSYIEGNLTTVHECQRRIRHD